MDGFPAQRQRMVERQVETRGIRDQRVLRAMRAVPREEFLAAGMREFAYEDSPLPIEAGQTISQPYIVALMLEAAALRPGDRVLEIGAGSGYAAAVMSRLAADVFTIERHPELAALARARLQRLGIGNVVVRAGDGSGGWPEEAPFDAILAAAGAPAVPDALRRQLTIGGRLVMPVGATQQRQQLLKLTRMGEDEWQEEDLGDVLFVPLVGAHAWRDDAPVVDAAEPASAETAALARAEAPIQPPGRARAPRPGRERASIPSLLAATVEALPDPDEAEAFGERYDRYGDATVVLLGEASHGTSEFYRARAAITRRLVERHGFRIVAVEADWPDAAAVDRHVRGQPRADAQAEPRDPPFQRFPTWMWRNREMATFVEWLRQHNAGQPPGRQVSFHGLDLYSLNASIHAVVDYLDRVDPDAAAVARHRYGCLAPWASEPAGYGRMALTQGYALCEAAVTDMLRELLDRRMEYTARDGHDWFDAAQNARLVRNAEAYYRAMYYGSAESWNLRDSHMFQTLQQLLDAGGPGARAVVWAHNSHIGDARETEMGEVRGEHNLGQLAREAFGDAAVLLGFGTHAGTVAAASDWDAPMQVMRVNPSRPDSVERLFHDAGTLEPSAVCSLLDLRGDGRRHGQACDALAPTRLERYIGVVYRPDTERWSHYAASSLSRQYDGWTWFDHTRAVDAFADGHGRGVPETWPFGV
jgi:protein-L-isoaspartate(D-aspartate) O-methyltransferase